MRTIAIICMVLLAVCAVADYALLVTKTGHVIDIRADSVPLGTKELEHIATKTWTVKQVERNPKRKYVQGICVDLPRVTNRVDESIVGLSTYKINPKANDSTPLKWESANFKTGLVVRGGSVVTP